MAVRLISAFIGIAFALLVLFLNGTVLYPIVVAALISIILSELIKAVDGLQFRLGTAGVMLYGIVTPFLEFYHVTQYSLLVHFVCLLLLFGELIWHPKTFKVEQISFMAMTGILVTRSIDFLISLKDLDQHGIFYVVVGLCGAWIADSGAYFAGVFLGKHKLCPEISPKKTVEGFIGGIVANAVVFVLLCFGYSLVVQNTANAVQVRYPEAALLGVVCALISVMGDLCASVVKRQKNIKDYGTIMPGHGGMMDRFDSVLFVLPTMYLFLTVFSLFE